MNMNRRIETGRNDLRRVIYLPFEARYRGLPQDEVWKEVEEVMGLSKKEIEELVNEYEAEKKKE